MKIKLLINLENYQNITFVSNNSKDRLEIYGELLRCVEDWVGYSPHALKIVNHIRKILKLDSYEVVYEGLEVVQEVEIKKQPKTTKKIVANGKYKVSGTLCKKCAGYISWDGYDKSNPSPPIHVDEDGNIDGNGDCPEYDGGG